MAVITISRETGCSGSEVAEKVAARLGYHIANKKTIGSVFDQYGFIDFREIYATQPTFWTRLDAQSNSLVSMLGKVTLAFARHGNIVILGRGSYAVLSGYTDVLNVRLQAPFRYRVMNYMEKHHVLEYEWAESSVKDGDKLRASFVESYYTVRWDSSKAFDLVFDVSKFSQDDIVGWIVEAANIVASGTHDREPSAAAINVDSTMQGAVSGILACQKEHHG